MIGGGQPLPPLPRPARRRARASAFSRALEHFHPKPRRPRHVCTAVSSPRAYSRMYEFVELAACLIKREDDPSGARAAQTITIYSFFTIPTCLYGTKLCPGKFYNLFSRILSVSSTTTPYRHTRERARAHTHTQRRSLLLQRQYYNSLARLSNIKRIALDNSSGPPS
jgi:hypothetical protein